MISRTISQLLTCLLFLAHTPVSAYSSNALICYKATSISSFSEAAIACHAAAKEGDSEAQYKLAVLYAQGRGLEQNIDTAMQWLKLSATQGHKQAQYNLATAYHTGDGVIKNIDLAIKWYRESAKNGYAKAQYNLAYLYELGTGVERDLHMAFLWFRKAAENGLDKSQLKIGLMLLNGEGTKADLAAATDWIRQSATLGNADAQFALASILLPNSPQESQRWFERAIAQKHVTAMYKLAVHLSIAESLQLDLRRASALADQAIKSGHSPSVVLRQSIEERIVPAAATAFSNIGRQAEENLTEVIYLARQPAAKAHWLTEIPPEHYTIQLIVLSSLTRVEAFIKKHDLESSARHHATRRKGRTVYFVTLGDYTDISEARRALNVLPGKLLTVNPILKQVGRLQDGFFPPTPVDIVVRD